jgi:hypothetical protein
MSKWRHRWWIGGSNTRPPLDCIPDDESDHFGWPRESIELMARYPIEVKCRFKVHFTSTLHWLDEQGFDYQWCAGDRTARFNDKSAATAYKLQWA